MIEHLSTGELASLRKALLKKGAELADKLSRLMAGEKVKLDELLSPRPGETPIEKARRYLALVDRKIKSIDAGTFGRCDACGAALSYPELDGVPWMETCRACAAKGID
jgi:RNA polymerase-binding transcription factor DksA